jgi:hypothetical protein
MHSVTVHLAKRAPPPQILFIVLMCAAYALWVLNFLVKITNRVIRPPRNV